MRFRRLFIKSFGKFNNKEIGDIDSNVVVVCGNNEAGKSTIFNIIETLLYGFDPASSQLHAYSPWETGFLEVMGDLQLDDGEHFTVSRRMTTYISGRISKETETKETETMDIKNSSIPGVRHISREIFEEVYSLSFEDMSFFGKRTWPVLQEKILSGMGIGGLKPVKKVLDKLYEDAQAFWRDDKRGKPESKRLEHEIRLLKEERRLAKERYEEIYYANEKITQNRVRIDELNEKKQWLMDQNKKEQKSDPLIAEIKRLEELPKKIIDIPPIDFDTRERLRSIERAINDVRLELKNELEQYIQKLRQQREEIKNTIDKLQQQIHKLLTMTPISFIQKVSSALLVLLGLVLTSISGIGKLDSDLIRVGLLLAGAAAAFTGFKRIWNSFFESNKGLGLLEMYQNEMMTIKKNYSAQGLELEKAESINMDFVQDINNLLCEELYRNIAESDIASNSVIRLSGKAQRLCTEYKQLSEMSVTFYELNKVLSKITEYESEIAALKEKIRALQAKPALDMIDSKIAQKEQELYSVKQKRDRLELLATIIKHADRRLREEYQPEVLKRAAEYLEKVTDGRYNGLFLEETEQGDQLMVSIRENSFPVKVDFPFSRGTLDQIQLLLRLSLIDYLDTEHETLPICFDELFTNWDQQRTKQLFDLLKLISDKRQIFIFTCNTAFAEEAIANLDAKGVFI